MASIDELYQAIIIDHSRRPRNFGEMGNATHSACGNNPLCGDETRVHLMIAGGQVVDAGFSGQGCAISVASASMLTDAIMKRTPDQVRTLAAHVLAALSGDTVVLDFQQDGDLASLAGVRKFPARIKCATLPWRALLAALDGTQSVSTESGES